MILTRKDVEKILKDWQLGKISAAEVHNWAEDLYLKDTVEYVDWEGNNEHSVTNQVLAALDMLDMNLITDEDIKLYLNFLATPIGEFNNQPLPLTY